MDRVWITNGSTSVAPVVNPLAAACHDGYVPTDIYILDNPEIRATTETVTSLVKTVIDAHGGEEPRVTVETLEDETDFRGIIEYLEGAIEAASDEGASVAVDVTPGRKFWSIISFRAAREFDVDHIYYVHLSGEYFGELYPTIPRTAIDLIDFTEVA